MIVISFAFNPEHTQIKNILEFSIVSVLIIFFIRFTCLTYLLSDIFMYIIYIYIIPKIFFMPMISTVDNRIY